MVPGDSKRDSSTPRATNQLEGTSKSLQSRFFRRRLVSSGRLDSLDYSAQSEEDIDKLSLSPQDKMPSWWILIGLCAASVVICYADRSNISTAILPMAETFGWDKVSKLKSS